MKNENAGKDLTTGKIGPQLWSLAWPMMLSMFFYTLYNLVDAYWVSKLSASAIAAVSVSQISLFLMISVGFGITVGSGVIMAMNIGAKNKHEAERVLGQSFVLSGILGIFFTIIALVFRNELLVISGATGEIFEPALQYFTVTSTATILFFILMTIMFAFNSQGDTFTLTKLFAFSTFLNLVLDPLLIFGWGPVPAWGMSGAAIATIISQAAFVTVALRSLSSPKRSIQFHFKNLSFNWESVKQVLKIGVPAIFTQVLTPVGLAALTFMAGAVFMEAGAVAFSIGFRLEFFAYLPAVGFGFAAMAMMGQSMGAKNIKRAREVFHTAIKYGAGIALVMGLLAALFAQNIIGVFTTDPAVHEYAQGYFHIVALSYVFLAAMMVEASAFQSMGRSWPGFWIMFIRLLVVTIPLSYVLTVVFHFPIAAIWTAIAIGNIIASVVGYLWIHRTMKKFNFHDVKEAVQTHS